MNGINPREVGRFWEKWHPVTTRFRKDNKQLRFVYANDIAWQALVQHQAKFPDGAMMAKLAYTTRPDLNFPASFVPDEFTRIQVMKKDDKAYPTTGGWGYAIFRDEKVLSPDGVQAVATACHACHQLVTKKDYVFSVPAFLPPRLAEAGDTPFAQKFVQTEFSTLSSYAQKSLRKLKNQPFDKLRVARMKLFTGSLGESVAALGDFAQRTGDAHLLIDESSQSFLAVMPEAPTKSCATRATFARRPGSIFYRGLKRGSICDGKVRYDDDRHSESATKK
jgi:hypothetical protein